MMPKKRVEEKKWSNSRERVAKLCRKEFAAVTTSTGLHMPELARWMNP